MSCYDEMRYLSLPEDREKILSIVKKDGKALSEASNAINIRQDKEIVLAAVQ